MFLSKRFLSWVVFLGLTAALIGCGARSSQKEHKTTTPPETSANATELSEADAALAKQQRVCPVSGDVLGAMGKPYKVTLQGKTVFLCCSGCEEELRKNPEKYLSKLESPKNNSPK
jgi:YHS domain-containing protein